MGFVPNAGKYTATNTLKKKELIRIMRITKKPKSWETSE